MSRFRTRQLVHVQRRPGREIPHYAFRAIVEALFGGAHSNFYGNPYKNCFGGSCVNLGKSPSNNAFDFIIGGGIDIPLTQHFSIRPAQFDYLLTPFGNSLTAGNNNQSKFRYQAGVQFRF